VVRRSGEVQAAMTVRLVMAMTLVPDGPVPEVICRAAGLLVYLPWARPWHVPGTEAVTRRRDMIPAELFEALFWLAAGPIADPGEPGTRWRELLLCAWTGSRSGSRTPRRTGSTSARPAPRTTLRHIRRSGRSS
jgi:Insertion element 4 transposase N-terminal